MSNYEKTFDTGSRTRFSAGLMPEIEESDIHVDPIRLTTFNAGDIVPVACWEVLPRQGLSCSIDSVIRQTTLLTPTMGNMEVEYFAFFVPNRVVNLSSKSVFGENVYDTWAASAVSFAPLYNGTTPVKVPVCSVADYYDFPTQQSIPASVLNQANDLRFRGYIEIYNEYFRDQNYQPPVPYSKLNVHEGFFETNRTLTYNPVTGTNNTASASIPASQVQDNGVGASAVQQAVYGNNEPVGPTTVSGFNLASTFSALGKPFKANKIHDYFTSVLPAPQKAVDSVMIPATGSASFSAPVVPTTRYVPSQTVSMQFARSDGSFITQGASPLYVYSAAAPLNNAPLVASPPTSQTISSSGLYPSNLFAVADNVDIAGLGIDINDFRMAVATQQLYEGLGRCGSRYREYVRAFFGLEVDDPFKDIPQLLGKFTRSLDLYQTAQTSGSVEGETPQGNLAAYGYTASAGFLFKDIFYEHGYVHVFAVVRHRNIYPSYMPKDIFRRNLLDFYQSPFANIGNQPLFTYQINPFAPGNNVMNAFGYQEAWSEYRFYPDTVSGYMRPGIDGSLAVWNYSDNFDPTLVVASDNWLKSNSETVLNRTLAVTSDLAPQFKAQICFHLDVHLPMPTYSVPGLDII